MAKKILIVDDQEKFRDEYSKIVRSMGIEAIVACSVKEGIEKALFEKPDAIITDKDMPDGSGNDLAFAVKKEYDVKIAGITGGEPEDFIKFVDVKASKSISTNEFKKLVNALFEKDPAKAYENAIDIKNDFGKAIEKMMEEYTVLSILVQGYIAGAELNRGINPVPGLELRTPTKEEMENLFDFQTLGVDSKAYFEKANGIIDAALNYAQNKIAEGMAFYKTACALKELKQNPDVKTLEKNITEKNLKAITEAQCRSFYENICKVMESYKKSE